MTVYLLKNYRLNYNLFYFFAFCVLLMSGSIVCISVLDGISFKLVLLNFILTVSSIFSLLYIQKKYKTLFMKKITITDNELIMFSSNKKKNIVDMNKDVYYEIASFFVGKYVPKNQFIIVSNEKFNSFKSFTNIGQVCKELVNNEKIVIVPYNTETAPKLNISFWIMLSNNYNTDDGSKPLKT